jgi:hypothetical protein
MRIRNMARGLGVLAAVVVATSCKSLDIENPNEPSSRILTDPNVLESVAGGTMRQWFNQYSTLEGTGVLNTQARTLSASWNNGNMNFYSSIDINATDTTADPSAWTRGTRSWQNDLSAAARTSVEVEWFGMYSALSAANDALRAIRSGGVVIGSEARTKRAETIAQLMQGASLMVIALNYDQGYYVDENTTEQDLPTLQRIPRRELRDSALKKLDAAIALADANTFTTESGWANGITYSNTDIAKIANTMAAMLLTWYPRDDAEASTAGVVDWAKVASYASKGMSTGTPVTLAFNGDGCSAWCQAMMPWFTDWSTGRVSTRVAHFLDPATQIDPYPLGVGSPQPNSPDKRLGDGSFGDESLQEVYDNIPRTPNAGTDFAYSPTGEVYNNARGYYHQSNIGIIRWDESKNQDPTKQWAGYSYSPVITSMINDLLWAEALLRQGGAANLTTAASLIDKTRVGRGGLSSAALAVGTPGSPADGPCMSNGRLAKDGGPCTLWSMLLYENEIEMLQLGPAGFWNQRHLPVVKATAWERATGCRKPPTGCTPNPNTIFNGPRYIQGLLPGTPREMPVPAKELAIKAEPFYTFGGSQPPKGPETP